MIHLFVDDPTPDEEPETIGQLYDRLPADGEWHEVYGLRVKRLPPPDEADGDA